MDQGAGGFGGNKPVPSKLRRWIFNWGGSSERIVGFRVEMWGERRSWGALLVWATGL